MSEFSAITHHQAVLQFKELQLDTILQLTKSINENVHAPDLYQYFKEILQEQLGIKNFAIFVFDQAWRKELVDVEEVPEPSSTQVEKHLSTYLAPSPLDSKEVSAFPGFEYVIPVYHKSQALAYILVGEFAATLATDTQEILSYLQTLSNIIIVAIENKRLFKREMEKKQFDKELELASKVQNMLIPNKLPKNNLYEFAGFYLPFKGIGGDYYDVIHINKNEFLFCIADISGKGVAAALVMANLQASLNSMVSLNLTTKDLVARLNQKIYSITKGENFITFFIGKYNLLKKELYYINAGHNPPLLIQPDGTQQMLTEGCTILGVFEDLPSVSEGYIKIQNNTTILAFTDGLTELENPSGEQYGMENLATFCEKNYKLGPDIFIKILYDHISKFKGNMLFNDDISVLACKFW
ncbi:MAG: serine/threonine-protein phosphatase [Chitinophagales bacterium]|nr:serine/threonine-protein phosphatase [Chitinophagales bacterium]